MITDQGTQTGRLAKRGRGAPGQDRRRQLTVSRHRLAPAARGDLKLETISATRRAIQARVAAVQTGYSHHDEEAKSCARCRGGPDATDIRGKQCLSFRRWNGRTKIVHRHPPAMRNQRDLKKNWAIPGSVSQRIPDQVAQSDTDQSAIRGNHCRPLRRREGNIGARPISRGRISHLLDKFHEFQWPQLSGMPIGTESIAGKQPVKQVAKAPNRSNDLVITRSASGRIQTRNILQYPCMPLSSPKGCAIRAKASQQNRALHGALCAPRSVRPPTPHAEQAPWPTVSQCRTPIRSSRRLTSSREGLPSTMRSETHPDCAAPVSKTWRRKHRRPPGRILPRPPLAATDATTGQAALE